MNHYTILSVAAILLSVNTTAFTQSEASRGQAGLEANIDPASLHHSVPVATEANVLNWSLHTFTPRPSNGLSVWNVQPAPHSTMQSAGYQSARASGVSGYTTALGLRGGYTSGVSLKHFIKTNAALEFVLGTRWEGFSFTMLYEWHKPSAFGVRQLTWEYGLGARVGHYRGSRYYGGGRGSCNNPNDNRCASYWGNRNLTAVGLVAIGGLEYKFDEIPFTISIDLMPVIYLNYGGGDFIDGSLSVRYIIN
jgi:hypothetical protein